MLYRKRNWLPTDSIFPLPRCCTGSVFRFSVCACSHSLRTYVLLKSSRLGMPFFCNSLANRSMYKTANYGQPINHRPRGFRGPPGIPPENAFLLKCQYRSQYSLAMGATTSAFALTTKQRLQLAVQPSASEPSRAEPRSFQKVAEIRTGLPHLRNSLVSLSLPLPTSCYHSAASDSLPSVASVGSEEPHRFSRTELAVGTVAFLAATVAECALGHRDFPSDHVEGFAIELRYGLVRL